MAEESSSSSGSEERNLAMIAHILGVVVGFVGPLIIYLTSKDKKFAYVQAKSALNFQITITIGWAICFVLAFVGIGFILYPALFVVNLIFCIMAAMAVSKGEDYKYPFSLELVK